MGFDAERRSARGSGRPVDSVGRRSSSRASTRPSGVIDTHAHLQGLRGRRRCRDRGGRRSRASSRSSASATRRSSPRRRSTWRALTPASSPRSGCTRTAPSSGTTTCAPGSTRCSRDPRGRGRGGVRPRLLPRPCVARGARRARSRARSSSRERHGKPLVIHTREAADDTLAVLREARAGGRAALLLAARAPGRGASSAAGTCRSRAT